jgi:Mitochondrial ribosomal protein L27|eukprot:jgi/Chrpa1/10753/Chrysochromulina_OHIO_Genome00004948-RA
MFERGSMLGILTQLTRRVGSHTPAGNFSSKRGNKNFYKGRGGNKYGIPGPKGGFIHRSFPKMSVPDMSDFELRAYVHPNEGLQKTGVLESAEK